MINFVPFEIKIILKGSIVSLWLFNLLSVINNINLENGQRRRKDQRSGKSKLKISSLEIRELSDGSWLAIERFSIKWVKNLRWKFWNEITKFYHANA